MNELIKQNKRVIVGFVGKTEKQVESDLLWPNVQHQWGDKDEVQELLKYFNSTLCADKRRVLRSAMAELTPKAEGIISGKYESLRTLAQIVNVNYMNWFNEWFTNCINIVAADYFLGSNVVEIAINANMKRNSASL